jgi:hypothetical protein
MAEPEAPTYPSARDRQARSGGSAPAAPLDRGPRLEGGDADRFRRCLARARLQRLDRDGALERRPDGRRRALAAGSAGLLLRLFARRYRYNPNIIALRQNVGEPEDLTLRAAIESIETALASNADVLKLKTRLLASSRRSRSLGSF